MTQKGQEPLVSLHMILGEERRREEQSEETDFIMTDFQNRVGKKKSYSINTRSHPSPESWQEGPGAGLRCKLSQH